MTVFACGNKVLQLGAAGMCHERLSDRDEPPCVAACPEEAIRIEIVNVAEWRREYSGQANAPGLPNADDNISTTTAVFRLPCSCSPFRSF
jgi:Fe-S-cluster-containing dehydrogenase component